MRGPLGMTVVKLGGSYAFSTHLKSWIDAITACAGCVVVAPGGGPFADAVRMAQPKMGFDDAAAHEMALLAMDQYGRALASLGAKLTLAASATAMRRVLHEGGVPVWSASRMVRAAGDIPWSWDVTSDSLAAWLAGRIGAKRVLLVKHVEPRAGPAARPSSRGGRDRRPGVPTLPARERRRRFDRRSGRTCGGCHRHAQWRPGWQPDRPALEHDPEKWVPVFGKDHAPAIS